MRVLLALLLLALLNACGGTSSWTWHWASDDGHSTIDARYDGTAKPEGTADPDVFTYRVGDPRFPDTW